MKKCFKFNKKIYFLLAIVSLLTLSSCFMLGKAITNDLTVNLELLEQEINASLDECWKDPATNRKNAMCNKLVELQELIDMENFEDAYDKLLYDIKPKLTGLKTDEHEQSWGNGVYDQAWIICEDLRETFRGEINLILAEINPQSVYDDDKTPPEISIIYVGEQYVNNPGVWNVDIGDTESGLDIVIINVNGFEEIYDIQGDLSVSYAIPVPAILGMNTIVVTATNDDKDFVGDQETSSESDWITIINTPAGTYIEVSDEETGVDITFSEITDVGITTVEESFEGPEPPPEFIAISDYYEITTDALFTGSITIAIPYDENQFSVDEQFLRLLHWDAIWNDITTDVDIENNILYGEVIELSTFLIAADINSPLINNPEDTNYLYGSTENTITWIATDENPGSYSVLLDGGDYSGGMWESGIPITINIDGLSLGTHEFIITVYDTSENYASDVVYVNVYEDDDSPPVILISHYQYRYDHPRGEWRVFVEDLESGLDEIIIEIDGYIHTHDINLNGIKSLAYYNLLKPVELGEHTISVTAKNNDNDYVGDQDINIAFDSFTRIPTEFPPDPDPTDPNIYISLVEGGIETPSVWLVDVSDPESGLDEIIIEIDGNTFIHETNLDGILNWGYDVPVPAEAGIHAITITAINSDTPGFQETSIKNHLVYVEPSSVPSPDDDTSEPTIVMNYVTDGNRYGNWRVYIEDPESGLNTVQILIDGIEYVYDNTLNGLQSKLYQFWVLATVEQDEELTEEGNHVIEVIAVNNDNDYSGDEELTRSIDSIYIDATRPVIDHPEDICYLLGSTGNTIAWTPIDNNPDSYSVVLDGECYLSESWETDVITIDIDGLSLGTHEVTITVYDTYNNYVSDTVIVTVDDDLTPPTVTISNYQYRYDQFWGEWRVLVEDLESGLDEIIIEIDGNVHTYDNLYGIISISYYNLLKPESPGEHTITVTAKNNDKDYFGDQDISTAFDSFTVPVGPILTPGDNDLTDPNINIEFVEGGIDSPSVWVVNVADPESGLEEVIIKVDGNIFIHETNLNGIINWGYDVPVPAEAGIHTITITAKNNDYLYFQERCTRNQLAYVEPSSVPPLDDDITAPTIVISYVRNGYRYGNWWVYIEDPESGLNTVQILIDGIEYVYDNTLNGLQSKLYQLWVLATVEQDEDLTEEGNHVIEVIAVNDDNDYSGDEELTRSIDSIYIDATQPIIDQPEDICYLLGSTGNMITWIATDDNPDSYSVLVDGGCYLHSECWETDIITINIDGLSLGTHEVTITVYDFYNNYVSDTVIVTVDDDLTPPTITISYEGDSNTDNPGVWNVYIEDLGSGIDTVKIYVKGVIIIDEQLGGIPFKSYDNIAVPEVQGIHKIKVIVKDSHQNEAQVIQDKKIDPGSSPPPPPIIVG